MRKAEAAARRAQVLVLRRVAAAAVAVRLALAVRLVRLHPAIS